MEPVDVSENKAFRSFPPFGAAAAAAAAAAALAKLARLSPPICPGPLSPHRFLINHLSLSSLLFWRGSSPRPP